MRRHGGTNERGRNNGGRSKAGPVSRWPCWPVAASGASRTSSASAGVIDTEVGYTGGWLENPTYHDTHDSKSGHAEAVRITFDPSVISYEDLLEKWFFKLHDPTTLNRQGNDIGTQYRSPSFRKTPSSSDGGASEGSRRGVGPLASAHHDDDRAGLDLVKRRGLPPGLPAQAPGRLHLSLHAGVVAITGLR